ncbi:hypothetical protein FKM82_011137 [Ascaphus truei]
MELEKYETETPSNKVLGKKIMISPIEPGTQPLTFSFVPIIGTLPTQVQVGKDSTFIPKIVKTLVSCRKEEMTHKPEQYPEHVSEKSIVGEDEGSLDPFCPTSTIKHIFPGKEVSSSNFEDMMQNDLFIAEFVLVMDSDEGEDDIMKKTDEILSFDEEGYESSGTQVSATPEPKGNLAEVNVNEICVPEAQHSDFLNYIDCPEKELQPYSTVPTAVPINFKPQDMNLICSTNRSVKHSRKPICYVSEKHENFTYFQNTTTCFAPANTQEEQTSERSSQTSKSLNMQSTNAPSSIINTQLTASPARVSGITQSSHFLNDTENQNPYAPASPVDTCARSNALSPLPVRIITHSLCRSPSPLQSPFYGSSSTICSTNDPCSPMSPTSRSEIGSPVSSRLSFLTSLLKSGKSRPFSPNFYQFNLACKPDLPISSLLQKTTLASTIPRKSFSCFNLDNPEESKMAQFQKQAKYESKMLPSVSESNILHADPLLKKRPNSTLSPDSIHFKTSANLLATQQTVVSPSLLLQHKISTHPYSTRESISPLNVKPPLKKDTHKPLKKYSVLGKSRKVSLFPSAISPNWSHSRSYPSNQRQNISSNSKKYTVPTDHFGSTTYTLREPSVQNHFENISWGSSPSLSIIDQHPFSRPDSKPLQMLFNKDIHSILKNSTSLYTNNRSHSNSLSLEELPRTYEPKCTSPDNIQLTPRSRLSRSSELSSTQSLSQCSDPDNKKSYKIKSSYKAFAAIPTNTLLMDQKATDEPEINEANTTLEEKMETHSEVYSPAQLRQETEDICAAIDKVLHDPLPMQGNSPSRSSIMKLDSKTGKASIQPTMAAKANSQPTKPGMIRRLPLKVNLTKKKEDNSNRFKYFATSSSRRETDYVVSSVLGSCEPNQPCHGNKKMDTKMDNEKDLEQQHNVFK